MMPVEKGSFKNSSKVSMPVEVNSEERRLQPERVEVIDVDDPQISEIVSAGEIADSPHNIHESFQEYFPESKEVANLMGVMIPAHVGFVKLIECPYCQRKFNE